MIINQLKEVQLVKESSALKLDALTQQFQRYDRTVYIEEPSPIPISGTGEAYIEAQKLFTLLPETAALTIETDCVKLVLKNKAEYKFPKLDLSWDSNPLPRSFNLDNSVNIKLASGRLNSATLKNLANPMLQCIYLDDMGGISCNSMVACLDGTTKTINPILLPPDIVLLMEGKESQLEIIGDNFVIKIADSFLVCPVPNYDYSQTAQILRETLPIDITKYPVNGLFEEVKRLSAFGDFLSFDGERVLVGENFEPFIFPSADTFFKYGIQYLLTVLPQVTHVAQSDFALLLYGDRFVFMVSPEKGKDQEA